MPRRVLVVFALLFVLPGPALAGDFTGVWSVGSTDGSMSKTLVVFPAAGGRFGVYDRSTRNLSWGQWVSGLEGTQATWTWSDGSTARVTLARDGASAALSETVTMSRTNRLDEASAAAGIWKAGNGSTITITPAADGTMYLLYDGVSAANRDPLIPLSVGGTWTSPNYWSSSITITDNPFAGQITRQSGASDGATPFTWTTFATQFTFAEGNMGSCTATLAADGARRYDVACSDTGANTSWTNAGNWPAFATVYEASWVAGLTDVQFSFADGCKGAIPNGGQSVALEGCGGGSWTRTGPWPVTASAATPAGNTIAARWRDGEGNFWTVPASTTSPFDVKFEAGDGRSMKVFSARWTQGLEGMQFVVVFEGENYDECSFTFNPSNPSQLAARCNSGGELGLERVP